MGGLGGYFGAEGVGEAGGGGGAFGSAGEGDGDLLAGSCVGGLSWVVWLGSNAEGLFSLLLVMLGLR